MLRALVIAACLGVTSAAPSAMARSFLRMADARQAAAHYAASAEKDFGADRYSVGRCQRRRADIVTCPVFYSDVTWAGYTDWTLEESVTVMRRGEHLAVRGSWG